MRLELVVRIGVGLFFAFVGWQIGNALVSLGQVPVEPRLLVGLAVAGMGLGLLFAPYLTIKPTFALWRFLKRQPARRLLAAVLGLALGLAISLPLDYALSFLPPPWGRISPLLGSLALGFLGVLVFVVREDDLAGIILPRIFREGGPGSGDRGVLLDTSIIIDGRIKDVSQTGFVERTMIVPRFILHELQHIADSPDALRRNRGRRGLDILNWLQKESKLPLRIMDAEVAEVRDVDAKLVALARRLRAPILTNDYNLNRVAELQGVRVLNINELANAVKTVFLPGESMKVEVIQEGKEAGQGVGYLDDGTMIVVENGKRFIGNRIDVVVTRVLQTVAGRMIFAQLEDRR